MGIINPFAQQPDETTIIGGEKIRLLICHTCKTIEPLDDYTGPKERADEYDVVLNVALDKHKDGVERRPHVGDLGDVPKAAWEVPEKREQIIKQLQDRFNPNADVGLGAEAYALRDNFRADAMACFEQHLRNPACSDYKDPSKQLIPNTQAERKEAGIHEFVRGNPATQRFLCEYCPVHSLVQQNLRKKAGLYDQ